MHHESGNKYYLNAPKIIAACALFITATGAFSQHNQCSVTSGEALNPVIELFTSEGCSSCPPADKWVSSLKTGGAVVQAFHVGYWDYIGWVDRFAAPAYTQRQWDIAAKNSLGSIYTPQVVRDGKDWPRWGGAVASQEPARASIVLKQLGVDQYEASVTPVSPTARWSAYWTVTEHGHKSKVLSGENKGEFLKHDFVVRQLVQAGDFNALGGNSQILKFRSIAATPGHERQINVVVLETQTGKILQAVRLQCSGV